MSDSSISEELDALLREKHQEYSKIDTPEEARAALTILAITQLAEKKGNNDLTQSKWAPKNLAKPKDTTQQRQMLVGDYQIQKENIPPFQNTRPLKNNPPAPKIHPAGWVPPHLRHLQKAPSSPPQTSSTSPSQGSATTTKADTSSPSLLEAEPSTSAMPSSIGCNSISTSTESEVREDIPQLQKDIDDHAVPPSNWASICPVKAPVEATGAINAPSTPPRANGNTGASIQSVSSPDKPICPIPYVLPHLRKRSTGTSNPSVSSPDKPTSPTPYVLPHLRKRSTGTSNPSVSSPENPDSTSYVLPHLRKKTNTGASVPSNEHTSTPLLPPHLRGSQKPAATTQQTTPSVDVVSPLSSAPVSECGSSSSAMNGAAKTFMSQNHNGASSPPVAKSNDYILPHLRTKQSVQSVTPEKARMSSASASRDLGQASSADAFSHSFNPPVARSNDYIPPHLRTAKITKAVGTSSTSQEAGSVSTNKNIKSPSSAAGSSTMENVPPHLRGKNTAPSIQSNKNETVAPATLPPHLRMKADQKAMTTPKESKSSFLPPHLRGSKGVVPATAKDNVPPHLKLNNKVALEQTTGPNAEVISNTQTPTSTKVKEEIKHHHSPQTANTPSASGGGVSLTANNAPRPTTPTNRPNTWQNTNAGPAAQWGAEGVKLVSGDEFFKAAGARSPLKSYKTEESPVSRRYEQNVSNYTVNNNTLDARPSNLDITPDNSKSSSSLGNASPERRTTYTVTQGTHGRQRIVEKYSSVPAKQPSTQQPTQEDRHLNTLITQSVHQTIEIKHESQSDPRTSVDKSNLLTHDALAKSSGFGASPSARGSDFKVSEEGIEQPKEGIRARQGVSAAEELMDWTGSLMPPPCDWEHDRTWFDNKWTPEYIAEEWRLTVPFGREVEVEMHSEEFLEKLLPIDPVNPVFLEAVYTEDSRPDTKNSENEQKRLHNTSQKELDRRMKKHRKHLPTWEEANAELAAQEAEIAAYEPMPNQFAPKIDIYLRPATPSDAIEVAKIYNHYICNTHIPEDQSPIGKEDAEFMIKNAKEDGLPFIVAIKGKAPVFHDVQGRPVKNKKGSLPACEVVVGFIFAEALNYNVKGNRKGRSRTTANLQVYVAPDTTRKGVGRNLLDHMLHSLKATHSFENACDWLNVDNDKIYTEENTRPNFHQLMFQLPILQKGDPYLEGVSRFLSNNNLFREQARLSSVGRTSPNYGSPKWLDLVYFQTQAWQSEAFGGLS